MFDFRPRSSAELLDATFEIYRRNFSTFFTIAVVGFLPFAVARLLITPAVPAVPTGSAGAGLPTPTDPFAAGTLTVSAVVLVLIGLVVAVLIDGAVIAAASEAYLGRAADTGRALTAAATRAGIILGASLLKGFAAGLGFLFFVIPGFYLLLRFFAVPATVVLENCGVVSSLTRSAALVKGNMGRILVLVGGTFLFYLFADVMLAGIIGDFIPGRIGAVLVALVIRALLYPIVSIVITLLYYDIRIRREGYDVELMARSLGQPPTPTTIHAL